MPEIFSPALFTNETRDEMKKAEKRGDESSNTKAQILKDDLNYIGEGGRVVVAATEVNPEMLVAVSMKETTPTEAKTIYYNQKLLKTLFPYNFPTIYAAWGKTEVRGVSANFRERINGRHFTKEETQKMHIGLPVESAANPFYKVRDTFIELDIPVVFDKNERNYMVSDYKDEMFVDMVNYSNWTTDQKNRVLSYMQQHGYQPRDIKIAETCLNRLLVLKTSAKPNS